MEKFSYHNSRFQNNENDNVKVFKFILKHSVFDHRCVDESCCKKWLGESWLVGGTIPGIARKCYDGRPAVVDRRPGSFSYPLSRGSAYFIVITWFFFFLSVSYDKILILFFFDFYALRDNAEDILFMLLRISSCFDTVW